MWKHALETVRCPRCKSELRLNTHRRGENSGAKCTSIGSPERPIMVEEWVETGALCCDACRFVFPIHRGVPILLLYRTQLGARAINSLSSAERRALSDSGFRLPCAEAPEGEKFVAASFSTEWAEYEYGDRLWIAPTAERRKTFRGECGLQAGELQGKRFCEVGCGLGIMTNEAADGLGAEAWGMDLSSAVFRAAAQFRQNPRLHFVQASLFAPPFNSRDFDFVYSHGVLHHTWSTKEAVKEAANLVSKEGSLYVWLYGYDDVRISMVRRMAFAVEEVIRPLLAKLPSRWVTALLLPLAPVYQLASIFGRRSGTHGSVYTVREAIHAARDRFTPLYAHRHEFQEVAGWLKELGFKSIHRVARHEVSPSWGLAIERNVAVRASRH